HTKLKTLARAAEQNRRRELEQGINGLTDHREDRIRTVEQLADDYLEDYKLRHKSVTFAEYAVGHVTRILGKILAVNVSDGTVTEYQSARIREKAAPKTINEEVGLLLRILGDRGDVLRAKLQRQKALKLPVCGRIGRAFTEEERSRLLAAAK